MPKSTEQIPKLTNEKILSFFGDKNVMEIHAKIPPPTHVPGGGYWLNGIEVNVEQLFDAYRTYIINERILMSKK
jgi:hypothetical protein